jgi:membrane protease YdiL (CAAX protease family)
MAFFPALFEEMFFRGALQNLLVRWWKMPILAIFVTALLFSLIHASVYLFLSRLLLGFVLGYLFYETKNLWVNTIAHFLNNLLALAQLFAMSRKHQPVDPSAIDQKVEWWLALIALFSLIFLFKLLHRYSVRNRMKIYTKEQRLYADAQIFSSIS